MRSKTLSIGCCTRCNNAASGLMTTKLRCGMRSSTALAGLRKARCAAWPFRPPVRYGRSATSAFGHANSPRNGWTGWSWAPEGKAAPGFLPTDHPIASQSACGGDAYAATFGGNTLSPGLAPKSRDRRERYRGSSSGHGSARLLVTPRPLSSTHPRSVTLRPSTSDDGVHS